MLGSNLLRLSEAIDRSVPAGSSVATGLALEVLISFSVGLELNRQSKQNPILISPTSDILYDQAIEAGYVGKIRAS